MKCLSVFIVSLAIMMCVSFAHGAQSKPPATKITTIKTTVETTPQDENNVSEQVFSKFKSCFPFVLVTKLNIFLYKIICCI